MLNFDKPLNFNNLLNFNKPADSLALIFKKATTSPMSGLDAVRQWLNGLKIQNRALAHFICRVIPTQCPFERTIRIFNLVLYIPPLCRLNPLYEEVLSLRFRALSYLADECQVDIRPYC
ncbi:Mo-dependent nitrogenase C-terminal domain-containing protein [Leptolyngbya sp. AN02str]|uniref:Mo-dependent nitrogenase C-terminal domain-containing protein n=1 Tax=Leptolyngbya sp. AN02str TaxID=3423363 RepID=UPI003D30F31A